MKKFIIFICLFAMTAVSSALEITENSAIFAPFEVVDTGVPLPVDLSTRQQLLADLQAAINEYLAVPEPPDTSGMPFFESLFAEIEYLQSLPILVTAEGHAVYKDGLTGEEQLIDLMNPEIVYILKITNQASNPIELPISIFSNVLTDTGG